MANKKIKKVVDAKTIIEAVPKVDINAHLKAQIEESTDYETAVTPRNRFLYILGIAGFIGISLVTSSVLFFYLTGFRGKSEDKSVTVIESQASPETKPAFERGNIGFEVLNGSGIPGAAKKTADNVARLGYSLVKTGNTTQTKGNKLYLKKDIEAYSTQIVSDLSTFNISTVSGEFSEGTASARLIIGHK